MQLTLAQRADFIQIAKDVYDLWSAGLSKDVHRQLLWSAYYHPWSKRNHYRLVFKDKGKVAVSCKIIYLPLTYRGRQYKMLGLGAIYTSAVYRGEGLATSLVRSIIDRARQEKIDCLLLLSEIDRDFYARCGFINLGNLDFEIDNNIFTLAENAGPSGSYSEVEVDNIGIEEKSPQFRFSSFSPSLENDEIIEILRCYNRWLSRQPYGIVRSHNYFTFQLAKHLFIATYSKNSRAKPRFTLLKNKQTVAAYAITERSHNCLRILEVVGSDAARAQLWHNLIKEAQQMGPARICGFESVSRDFVPYQRLDPDKLALRPPIRPSHITCHERFWGQPMFLPLNSVLDKLPDYNPCPFLEFDHF